MQVSINMEGTLKTIVLSHSARELEFQSGVILGSLGAVHSLTCIPGRSVSILGMKHFLGFLEGV